MIFCARQFKFIFPRPALVMGIVNVTPDSFSDGGKFAKTKAAIAHAEQLIEEGADIIDVGGESSRPGATSVSVEEELRRVIPVIEKLSQKFSGPISVDTIKPKVARAALQAGASIVNDIAANREDEEMWRLVAEMKAGYIAMHRQGVPSTMQQNPSYQDVTAAVNFFFEERLRRLRAAGVQRGQIVLDVGIGFGKTAEHNLELLAQWRRFKKWKRPLLLGVSRKSFLERLLGAKIAERLPASLVCACWAVTQGAQLIRTHDVAATKQAVRMIEYLLAKK
ncbi:MAG: dihydropteroate synthase [Limisphaerales bacterium]